MNFIKQVNTPELNTVKLLNVASGKTDTGAINTSDSPQTPLGETETAVESQKKVDLRITKSKADSIAIGADVTATYLAANNYHKIYYQATAPGDKVSGDIFIDSDTNNMQVWDGTDWQNVQTQI